MLKSDVSSSRPPARSPATDTRSTPLQSTQNHRHSVVRTRLFASGPERARRRTPSPWPLTDRSCFDTSHKVVAQSVSEYHRRGAKRLLPADVSLLNTPSVRRSSSMSPLCPRLLDRVPRLRQGSIRRRFPQVCTSLLPSGRDSLPPVLFLGW